MVVITEKKDCCGCGACLQACPKACISMQSDGEGFLYPLIDTQVCIQCGVCENVCPIRCVSEADKQEPEAVYAACARDEAVRSESSSGGIFSLLAKWILDQGGAVFGAAFAGDFSVHHIGIENAGQLHELRGSKYLQSRTEDTYREAKAVLEEGRLVLYSGTGCQVAGLKAFLRKDYGNLYTVDVLCHGVPSPKMWKHYLSEQERLFGNKANVIAFREKSAGWHNFAMLQVFHDGRTYRATHREDGFMQCFLKNICLRPSCHSCKFREGKSRSDLTLGDAWGIESWMPDMDDDRGTSVVLVNNEKGRQLWTCIAPQTRARQGDTDEILRHNPVYRKSVKPHLRRTAFFHSLNDGAPMEVLVRLSQRTLLQRALSLGKRCVKKLLRGK